MNYVLGFLFDVSRSQVALIRKLKPKWQKGYYNGIGGKIELDETAGAAMPREFKEETGVQWNDWQPFARIEGDWGTLHCFCGFETLDEHHTLTQQEGEMEIPEWIDMEQLYFGVLNFIPDLRWLIALALDHTSGFAVVKDISVNNASEQPPSNPAGPAASQQPAEAVSEAAREKLVREVMDLVSEFKLDMIDWRRVESRVRDIIDAAATTALQRLQQRLARAEERANLYYKQLQDQCDAVRERDVLRAATAAQQVEIADLKERLFNTMANLAHADEKIHELQEYIQNDCATAQESAEAKAEHEAQTKPLVFEGTATTNGASIKLHFKGEFKECRVALINTIVELQRRLAASASCPANDLSETEINEIVCDSALDRVRELLDERNAATRERDAIRAELEKLKTMLAATRDESIRVERERDEARECTALWIDREKTARAELATTRERLVNSEQRLIESAASNANEIAALRSQLQEAKRLNGELKHERDAARYIANQIARDLEIKRQKYGKIDADIRQAVRATGFCEIEGSTVGLVERICDLATQRVRELEELRAARRKEVRITFDKIEGSFSVTFGRTGQTVKFEKPKHVAGNVENWLANLRHAED